MGGIERSQERKDETHEVFTDTAKAIDLVNRIEVRNPALFSDPTKTIIDPAVGDGQLLSECLIRRLERGCDFGEALISLRGLDLMKDNVELCRERLLCGREEYRWWANKYIIQGDALKNAYNFGEPIKFGGGLSKGFDLFEIES
jgi:hypothetical protein